MEREERRRVEQGQRREKEVHERAREDPGRGVLEGDAWGSLLPSEPLAGTMARQHQGQLLALRAQQAGSPLLRGPWELGGHLGEEAEAEGFADYASFPPPRSYPGHTDSLRHLPKEKNGHRKDLRLP